MTATQLDSIIVKMRRRSRKGVAAASHGQVPGTPPPRKTHDRRRRTALNQQKQPHQPEQESLLSRAAKD